MAKRKNRDEDQPNDSDNINESDDTFGLPEIEYEPLDRDKSTEPSSQDTQDSPPTSYEPEQVETNEEISQPSQYTYMQEKEERRSSSAVIWIILVLLFLAGGLGAWIYYFKPRIEERNKKEAAERAAQRELERRNRQRTDSLNELARREQWLADSLASANPAVGTIEMLEDRTGAYRVVIASAIDDDLLMDYAKKLSKKGVSSKIVPPFGETKFYRLTIAEGDSWSAAQALADGLKGEYGSEVWVLRY
jgi:hypothetical protein